MTMNLYHEIEFRYDCWKIMYNICVSKSYSDDCTCSLTEQNLALNDLYYGQNLLFKKMKDI